MDETLSKFVDKTGCDPSFARDLLEGKQWNIEEALKSFKEFSLESSNKDASNEAKTKLHNKPQRGISVVNSDIVLKARNKAIEVDILDSNSQFQSYRSTFVLPDLSTFPRDLADFLREDLIEMSALVALEQSGHLNWWADIGVCCRLVPLATVGDGNCLLHAASLGMWGYHDRLLTLRKALFRTLADHPSSVAIYRRWRLQQYQKNMEAGGLVYTDEEWKREWDEVLRLASTNRRKPHTSDSNPSQPISTIHEDQPLDDKHVSSGDVKAEASTAKSKASSESKDSKKEESKKKAKEESHSEVKGNVSKVMDVKKEGKEIKSETKENKSQAKENKSQAKENKSQAKESKSQVKENESKAKEMENTVKENESRVKESERELKGNEQEKKQKDIPQEIEGAYESLEDIHVFVLAHVLRRPIIIIADKYLRDFSGDPIAPIPFGGIYLPLECPPQTCHRTPLLLMFESAHFSAGVVSDVNEEKSKQSKVATAIPVVDRDLSLLPLHFSVDPGEKFDWNSLSDETQLPSKLTLSAEKQLQCLEKYLNISHVKIPSTPKKENHQAKKDTSNTAEKAKSETENKGKKEVAKNGDGKEVSWFENSMNKVGNFAGMIKKLVDTSTVCVAKIPTNEKPEYYDQMINNYIESAKKRFEEKKRKEEMQNAKSSSTQQPCITPGCPLYGRADTYYLCSGCYKAQKSASESGLYKTRGKSTAPASENSEHTNSALNSFLPPVSLSSYVPYDYFSGASTTRTVSQEPTPTVQPPSYSEACKGRASPAKFPLCRKEGCEFYGSEERQGYCSSCFKKEKPSN